MLKKFAFILVMGAGLLGSCNSKSGSDKAETTTETASTNAAADSATTEQLAYICPMKCEGSASHEPGKCPVCTMDLVKNPDYKGNAAPDSTAL